MIYLDNAATTPVRPEVVNVITNVLQNYFGNPSSIYEYGIQSRKIIEDSRKIIAEKINCNPEEIYFTSGSCESNTWAWKILGSTSKYIVTTNLEHKSIREAAKNYKRTLYAPNDAEGFIELDILKNILSARVNASIQYANNEIGTIQDIKNISEMVHANHGYLHTDATQMICNSPINVVQDGIDMMSISGQKLGAPKGIGFLYIRKNIPVIPLIYGSQERGYRGGTENVAYIAGLAQAFKELDYSKQKTVRENRDYLAVGLSKICKIEINGSTNIDKRLNNNLNIVIPKVKAVELVSILDVGYNCCVSAGSACNSGSPEPSWVLIATGRTKEEALSSIRITLGEQTTKEEIDKFIYDFGMAYKYM